MNPIALLVLASLSLLVGPICGAMGNRFRVVHAWVDGFALTLVGGLCVVFVLPHVVGEIGVVGLVFAAGGAALPWLGHRLRRGRSWSFGLVSLALVAHVVLDGAVLATRSDDTLLAWAVLAHRLPVGFAVVVVVHALRKSAAVPWGLALMMIAATGLGYLAGPSVVAWFPHSTQAALEAIVAGMLLHVVFMGHDVKADAPALGHAMSPLARDHQHRGYAGGSSNHHAHAHDHGQAHSGHAHRDHQAGINAGEEPAGGSTSARWWAATGTLSGLLVLLAGGVFLSPHALEGSSVPTFLRTLGVLVLESSPALLLGYGLAGVIPFVLTPSRTSSLARGGRLIQSLRGVAFGLPLPVCSCGVLPLFESLVRRGAPPAAAMAFFVATPELGFDAVLLSVPLLGASLTAARVVSAFAVALLVALLVGGRSRTHASREEEPVRASSVAEPWSSRIQASLRFGFVEMFDHTMPWIALGLIVAALAEPMLSHGAIEGVPPVLQVPAAALFGVSVYVCASGATPVAALALHKGLSAGAAIAFLIAGPATNVTTFGVLARLHGRQTALRFGVSVAALAVLAGWTVDALGILGAPILDAHAAAEAHGSWFAWICVAVLVALTVASLFRQGPRGALRQILEPIHAH